MNIHQLRAICEVVKQGLRMSTAAETLFRSQPGISRQIREIEEEIGVQIFRRRTNKIETLTPAGHEVVRVAERILQDIESLRLIGKEYSANDVGDLTVATTHTQARYSLPAVIEAFAKQFPCGRAIRFSAAKWLLRARPMWRSPPKHRAATTT